MFDVVSVCGWKIPVPMLPAALMAVDASSCSVNNWICSSNVFSADDAIVIWSLLGATDDVAVILSLVGANDDTTVTLSLVGASDDVTVTLSLAAIADDATVTFWLLGTTADVTVTMSVLGVADDATVTLSLFGAAGCDCSAVCCCCSGVCSGSGTGGVCNKSRHHHYQLIPLPQVINWGKVLCSTGQNRPSCRPSLQPIYWHRNTTFANNTKTL